MTVAELVSAIYRHPFMLAKKLDGDDPKMCEVHGSFLFGDETCPFGGVVCTPPYPYINSELPLTMLEGIYQQLKNRDAEGNPNV